MIRKNLSYLQRTVRLLQVKFLGAHYAEECFESLEIAPSSPSPVFLYVCMSYKILLAGLGLLHTTFKPIASTYLNLVGPIFPL